MSTMTVEQVRDCIRALPVEIVAGEVVLVLPKKKLSVARYMSRELKLGENGWKDDQIRDLSDLIAKEIKAPPIIKAECPADYVRMFSEGGGAGSCYAVQHVGVGYYIKAPVLLSIYEKYKLWPSIWYHYCPEVEGYFLTDSKGRVECRCFAFPKTKSTGSYYGSKGHATLTKHMQTLGYTGNSFRSDIRLTEQFRVPGVEMDGHMWGAIIPCDNIVRDFRVTYHKDTKEFEYGPQGEMAVGSPYHWGGWISDEYKTGPGVAR